jgi:cbb3-type cytochrome oxidase cytochrome c subunit/cytochrome c5
MKMTFGVIFGGGLLVFLTVVFVTVFIPGWIYNPPQTLVAHERTAQEERGRVLFYSNGCNYCHTQYGRYVDNNGEPVANGGDYVFDNPLILGSERTGPDLAYLGRTRSVAWDIAHLKHPRTVSPLSIMPNFNFLSDQELMDLSTYLFNIGDRVSQQRMILPIVPYAGLPDPIPFPASTPAPANTSIGWATWRDAQLQDGKEIYINNCLTCHGCAGNGLGHYAGRVFVTPVNFKADPYKNMPDDEWFYHVSEGVPGTIMPVWKASQSLTITDRWKVIRYIQTEFANPVARDPDEGDPPPPYTDAKNPNPLTVANLDAGKAIWLRECMICHNDHGQGDGPYGEGIQPGPPNFNDPAHYGPFTDGDWFWRISEGLPWTAMPTWKLQYNETDRWNIVHYLRVTFAHTESRPKATEDQVYPNIYVTQTMPDSADFTRGQITYMQHCEKCHGVSGKGDGEGALILDPKPADFTDPKLLANTDGEWFAKTSWGVQDSAMPPWNEWLTESQRWDAIKYVVKGLQEGMPVTTSQVLANGAVASNVRLSTDIWQNDLGRTIDPANGKDLYTTFCLGCHGDSGQGNGPDTISSPSGSPAPFPSGMDPTYTFWRIKDGVPNSIMPPFKYLTFPKYEDNEQAIVNLTAYISSLVGSQFGAGGG